MKDAPSRMTDDLTGRIAARVRELRGARGLSLEALAGASGVSRSMISLVERGESSPTATVLERLATGLGVPLGSLFDAPATAGGPGGPLARRGDQPTWRDPGSGYVRRDVSPPGPGRPVRIVEVSFPAGGRVAFENGGAPGAHQQVWVLEGSIDVAWGDATYRLAEGDCLAMTLDRPTMFHNPSPTPARYAVVVATEPTPEPGR